jgi:hypothetical protein
VPHPYRRTAVLLAAGALLAACGDAPTDSGRQPAGAVAAAGELPPQAQDHARPGEARFRALAQKYPEFAGFYFDEQGDIVVQVTDLGRSAAVRAALAPVVRTVEAERARGAGGRPQVRFRRAEFSFAQLSEWRGRVLEPLFALDGVTMLDVDERENRLVVGLADESGRAEAQARLAELGVPLAMVALKVVGRGRPLSGTAGAAMAPTYTGCTSVYSSCRPLIGGIKISFYRDNNSRFTECTLGFAALSGSSTRFVTAAHCSDDEWNYDNTQYYQPDPNAYVGYESWDPNGWSCGFMSPYKCRYSDANLSTPSAPAEVGYIIRPSGLQQTSVNPIRPHFVVAGQRDAYVGERVYVVGHVTGLHTGTMRSTCEDWKKTFEGRYHAVLCSHVADFNSTEGDSGGPVFLWDVVSETVTLVGVNFARNGTWDHAVFSPMSGIQKDLGRLEARAAEYRGTTGGGGGDDGGGGCSGCELQT